MAWTLIYSVDSNAGAGGTTLTLKENGTAVFTKHNETTFEKTDYATFPPATINETFTDNDVSAEITIEDDVATVVYNNETRRFDVSDYAVTSSPVFWFYNDTDQEASQIVYVGVRALDNIALEVTPTASNHLVNKNYVDTLVAGTLIVNEVEFADKADKVASATAGHLAGLDASGNLSDSGSAPSDFASAAHSQTLSTITDAGSAAACDVGTVSGCVPVLNASGKLATSVMPAGALWTSSTVSISNVYLGDHQRLNCTNSTINIDATYFSGDCLISFNSGATATTVTGLAEISMSGDHCADGIFTPHTLTSYAIRFIGIGSRIIGFVTAYEYYTPVEVAGATPTIALEAGKRFVLTSEPTEMTLTDDTFINGKCQLVFTRVPEVTITKPANLTFTGVDCDGGTLTPHTGKTYVVTFTASDGSVIGDVDYLSDSEILPIIAVTAPSGTVVTCSKGNVSFTATAVDRACSFSLPAFGNWTLSGRLADQNSDQSVAISAIDAKIYRATLTFAGIVLFGVRHYVNESTPQLVRIEDSADFTFVAEDGSEVGASSFDNQEIFKDIKLCNVDLVDSEIVVTAYEGDDDFTRTPTTGDVCVEFQKFYYKRDGSHLNDASHPYEDLLISNKPLDGFVVDPAHADRGDGAGVRDKIYVGAYTANAEYRSVSGDWSKRGVRRATFRSGILARGAQYHLWDIATLSMIQILYKIAVANLNSQKQIGDGFSWSKNNHYVPSGVSDYTDYHTGCNPSKSPIVRRTYAASVAFDAGSYFFYDATLYKTNSAFTSTTWETDSANCSSCAYNAETTYNAGDLVSSVDLVSSDVLLWRALTTTAGSTPTEGENWTIFEPEFSTSATYKKFDRVIYNGALYECLNGVAAGEWISANWESVTGSKNGTAGTAVKFLGIENLWGDVWQYIDGSNADGMSLYICVNPSNYADATTGNYTLVSGFQILTTSRYIKKVAYNVDLDWLFLPTQDNASSSTYFCDTCYLNITGRKSATIVGGGMSGECVNGIFTTNEGLDCTAVYNFVTGRIMILP